MKKLYKTEGPYKMVAGVCGGLGEYLGIDPNIVRLVTVLLFFFGTLSFWVYLIAALILPRKSDIYPGF